MELQPCHISFQPNRHFGITTLTQAELILFSMANFEENLGRSSQFCMSGRDEACILRRWEILPRFWAGKMFGFCS
jgi:hypothetical protein